MSTGVYEEKEAPKPCPEGERRPNPKRPEEERRFRILTGEPIKFRAVDSRGNGYLSGEELDELIEFLEVAEVGTVGLHLAEILVEGAAAIPVVVYMTILMKAMPEVAKVARRIRKLGKKTVDVEIVVPLKKISLMCRCWEVCQGGVWVDAGCNLSKEDLGDATLVIKEDSVFLKDLNRRVLGRLRRALTEARREEEAAEKFRTACR